MGAQCRDSYFLEESRLSEQFLGENDGRKRDDRAGVHQGARPLGPLFSSSQSPLRFGFPAGHPPCTPLLLLSHPKPLTLGFGRGLGGTEMGSPKGVLAKSAGFWAGPWRNRNGAPGGRPRKVRWVLGGGLGGTEMGPLEGVLAKSAAVRASAADGWKKSGGPP